MQIIFIENLLLFQNFKLKDKRFSNNKKYINQIINSFNSESNHRQLTFYALVISTNNKIDLN